MALQDPNILSMVGLGTLHDTPTNPLQPRLVDAVHLPWAFRAERASPGTASTSSVESQSPAGGAASASP